MLNRLESPLLKTEVHCSPGSPVSPIDQSMTSQDDMTLPLAPEFMLVGWMSMSHLLLFKEESAEKGPSYIALSSVNSFSRAHQCVASKGTGTSQMLLLERRVKP